MTAKDIQNKDMLIEYLAKGKKAKYLCFWGHTNKNSRMVGKTCFSQWYASPFELEGIQYSTAEQYMMAEKARLFSSLEIREKILQLSSPQQAKALGREVLGFDEAIWREQRFDIVVKGNLAKFSHNMELKDYLLGTGNRILVEASPADKIWGIGLAEDHPDATNPFKWKGINLLGFALMAVRKQLMN